MKKQRLKAEVRKEEIMAAGLALAQSKGYDRITRDEVGRAVGVSGTTIQYHFPTMTQFRRELMRYAVRNRNVAVVAQGLVNQDPRAKAAPEDLKDAAKASLG